ncbi:MAG: Calx-beta domain-containing protein [Sphingomicrobium sp.]
MRLPTLLATSALALLPTLALASETISYSYDALGRLVQVARSGTVNDGVSSIYSYDKADNRTNLTVSTGTASPSFSVNDASATEGSSIVFTVTRSGSTSGSASVSYATANGTATAGSDYTAGSGTVSFAASETQKTVTITGLEDTVVESAENFVVNLSSPSSGAVIGDGQGSGTINDNDSAAAPSFTVNNASVTEGGNLIFTVTKTGTTSTSFSVNYATANGSAAAGSDYTSKSGTLTFAAADTSKTVSIVTTDDTTVESAETLYLNLSGATGGATISDPQGVGTINDNDSTSNNAPTPANDSGSIGQCETTQFNVTANDTDPDGDYPLTVTAVTGVGFSVFSASEVQFSSTQSTGIKTGTYTIRDSLGATATATLSVTVTNTGTCTLADPGAGEVTGTEPTTSTEPSEPPPDGGG